LLIAPIVPVLLLSSIYIGEETGPDGYSVVQIDPFMVMFTTMPISYFFMFLIGLPTIYFLEKERPSKLKSVFIYYFNATILPCLIGAIFILTSVFVIAPLCLIAATITAFIMLYRRTDW